MGDFFKAEILDTFALPKPTYIRFGNLYRGRDFVFGFGWLALAH